MYLTFFEAVILIFKHATFLRLSNVTSKSALPRAELDYRDANIDSSIQKYLMASSQEHSVELFAAFIMATDIVVGQKPCVERSLISTVLGTSIPSQVYLLAFVDEHHKEWSGNSIIGPCVMCTIHPVCALFVASPKLVSVHEIRCITMSLKEKIRFSRVLSPPLV
ncbi:hypothetical protein EDB83DRAFT_544428 [Lactarius deliciosus]|nr:hypothetical protein EDB83DRAFT_544428 [Lactarius deliciosus]